MANSDEIGLSSEKVVNMYQKLDPLLYYVRANFPASDSWEFPELIYKTYFIPDCKKDVKEILRCSRVRPKKTDSSSDDDVVDFDTTPIQEAIQRLNDCLTEENCQQLTRIFERQDLSENEVLVGCGVHLIKKLSGNAFTNTYRGNLTCPCGCGEKLQATDMCIGTSSTWYGELDMLAEHKSTNIIVKSPDNISDDENVEDNEEGQSCPRDCTNFEVEKNSIYAGHVLCKAIAESVVFAWTEYNRHPESHSCIPSILISNGKFAAFIYNPINDELYATAGYQNLNPKDNRFSGIFCLWVFLNHRLFFRKETEKDLRRMCGFSESVSEDKLKQYECLKDYFKQVNVPKDENEICLYPNMECMNWYL
ncbi:uncharacterized protein LOC123556495 [Mercenaria mercenaria]|uniref:uncharacterized protein LOC123556495 n=1 Tax=Mercenaria mercenaria TaxID=6596 RepID=UPI00234E419B|nr:uncharacterized protein LOC123556495 [Mercenaria mercenaria]